MTTFSAVVTTGIYCRDGCVAGPPRAENVRTFEHPAAAEVAGFRACLRCRPYRVAGAVPWDAPELVCRAVRLILDGVLDTGSEADLGHRLGLSGRHLRRLFHEHLGMTPDQLARSRRAHFARRMLDDTDLTVADIAFASGFGSLRQFNRTMREIFRFPPQDLRRRRRRADRIATDGGLAMRLPVPPDHEWDAALALLAREAVPGVEAVDDATYRRTITLDGAPGMLELRGAGDHLVMHAHLAYWEGLIHLVERVRRMLGLDFDIAPAVARFSADPVLGPLVTARPGLRVPGAWGPFETAVRVVVGRHHDDPRRLMGLLAALGSAVPGLPYGLSHAFPSARAVADADLRAAGLPAKVATPVGAFARAVATEGIRLDGSVPLDALVAALTRVTGIDATTAQHVAMRVGERDAFPLDGAAAAEGWRPWRALAATHLLASVS
ncbi:DNA-3-methyladenine glycosylase 2 [Virgisporangium ochraceum]|uniref:AraC family transcriptional regulator n=1 Tax=Virgisporangium ochraceum TaxID=65505 RepID=A0A8J4EBR6_9ACTN|nr:AlkA N-terminal domain-containing protein [Virgisporangium ochraceum]GIJ69655.1 AraC family transcriptional regulator [Virgisporangium ochraceum]